MWSNKLQVLAFSLAFLMFFSISVQAREPVKYMPAFPFGADDFIMYAMTFLPSLDLTIKNLVVTGVLTASETHFINTTVTEINVTSNITVLDTVTAKYFNGSWNGSDDYMLNSGDTASGTYNFDDDTLYIDSVNHKVLIGMTTPPAAPAGKLDVIHNAYPVIRGTRTSTATNTYLTAAGFVHKTTANMVDGFGVTFDFAIIDSSGTRNAIASFGAERWGGVDNSGQLNFGVKTGGVWDLRAMVIRDSKVGIGTTDPDEELEVVGDIVVTGTNPTFRLYESPTKRAGIQWNTANDYLNIFTIGGDILLNPGGNVGIMTTEPNATLHVAGDAIINENLTAENVWLPTYCFSHTADTQNITGAGVWLNVSFDDEASFCAHMTHTHSDSTNDTFTIQDEGVYDISYHMTFSDTAASPKGHIEMRVTRNGTEIAGSLLEEDSSKQYSDFTLSNGVIAAFTKDDEIRFEFTADDTTIGMSSHQQYGDHKDTTTIKIRRIG